MNIEPLQFQPRGSYAYVAGGSVSNSAPQGTVRAEPRLPQRHRPQHSATETGDHDAFLKEAETALTAAAALAKQLEIQAAGHNPNIIALWNQFALQLSNAQLPSCALAEVHPDATTRSQYRAITRRARNLQVKIQTDRRLFSALKQETPADDQSSRALDVALKGFREAGADLSPAERSRLNALRVEESHLRKQFAKNIRDDSRILVPESDELEGLPPQLRARLSPAGSVGLTMADCHTVLRSAESASLRQRMVHHALNVGWPDNDRVLRRLLAVRLQIATTLGYSSAADHQLATQMIDDVDYAYAFLSDLGALLRPHAERERKQILTWLRHSDPELSDVGPHLEYGLDGVREQIFRGTGSQTRPAFRSRRVIDGILSFTTRALDLEWRAAPGTLPIWSTGVTVVDAFHAGAHIGRVYLDLQYRKKKYPGCAHMTLAKGVSGAQIPQSLIVANFESDSIDYSDVISLFHEFGHTLHNILGADTQWVELSGVSVERDFVETPSEIFETLALDTDVIEILAHAVDGQAVPNGTIRKLQQSESFGWATDTLFHVFFAMLSLDLHSATPPADITSRVRIIQNQVSIIPYLPDTHMHTGFMHISSYGANYYTYLWSAAIAADVMSYFNRRGLTAATKAQEFCDLVLRPGGTRPPQDLLRELLGRPMRTATLNDWINSIAR